MFDDVPGFTEAYDYIHADRPHVKEALVCLVKLERSHKRTVRTGDHGRRERAFIFALAGTNPHPALAVNQKSLALYLGPHDPISIETGDDIPDDFFD